MFIIHLFKFINTKVRAGRLKLELNIKVGKYTIPFWFSTELAPIFTKLITPDGYFSMHLRNQRGTEKIIEIIDKINYKRTN